MSFYKQQLKQLRRRSKPSGAFKVVLWKELDAEFTSLYPTRLRVRLFRMVSIPVAVLVLGLTTGASSYAYASPNVTEDHTLYPVKRGIELVESHLQFSNTGRAKYQTRMMERRLSEMEVLVVHRPVNATDLEVVEKQLDRTMVQMASVHENDEIRRDLVAHLITSNARYVELIDRAITDEEQEGVEEVATRGDALNGEDVSAVESENGLDLSIPSIAPHSITPNVNVIEEIPALDTLPIFIDDLSDVPDVGTESSEEKIVNADVIVRIMQRKQDMRNMLERMRVKVNESNLTEDEKTDLLNEFEARLKDTRIFEIDPVFFEVPVVAPIEPIMLQPATMSPLLNMR